MSMIPWFSGGASLSDEPQPISVPGHSLPLPAAFSDLAAQPTRPQTSLAESTPMDQGLRFFNRPDPSMLEPETEPADLEILLPDLQVLPPFDLHLKYSRQTGKTYLRLAITFWNNGQGPLELRGVFNPASRQTLVWQSLYTTGPTTREQLAGEFIWHPGHEHWHFTNFAVYELWSVSADGALDRVVASRGKVTFCILETDILDSERPDFSRRRSYAVCGPGLQGLSVGWGDTYDSDLDGQLVESTGIPNGIYALVVRVDPANRILEADDANNTAATYIEFVEGRLYVYEGEAQMLETLRRCLRLC